MDNNQTLLIPDQISAAPALPSKSVFSKIKDKLKVMFSVVYNPNRSQSFEDAQGFGTTPRSSRFSKFNFGGVNKKKAMKIFFPLFIGIIVISGIVAFVRSVPDAQSTPEVQGVKDGEIIASKTLNKRMQFPIKDEEGEEVGKYEYTITSAELRNKIVVQGRNATAIPGRVFLVFNLKINNTINKPLQLNTRDYIRVTVASNPNEKLAADIHNDPVEVQAISTKYTRVGLAINEGDAKKPIKLQIGEINGSKQVLELNFN